MTSRYFNRSFITNSSPTYSKILKERNVEFIDQYSTPEFKYPTADQINSIGSIPHIWSQGDRFYKLAHKFYGDPQLWWVIAWYNRMPTEANVKLGWSLEIPTPLESALALWEQ